MSYACPATTSFSRTVFKGNHYSNPNVDYLGKPTGTVWENCARAIRENKVRRPGGGESVGTILLPV